MLDKGTTLGAVYFFVYQMRAINAVVFFYMSELGYLLTDIVFMLNNNMGSFINS